MWRPPRRRSRARSISCAHLGAPGLDRRELLEGRVRVLGEHPGQRRLPGPRRAVEDHRVRLAGLDRRAQRARRAEQVRLADELLERPRAHPRGQRQILGRRRARPAGGSSGTSKRRPMAHSMRYPRSMGLAEELQDETAEVLSSLIRFNTVNPPGNERECQEWLAGYLEDAGLERRARRPRARAHEPGGDAEGRATGRRSATSSHVDTVLADAEDWTADPWGGEIRDGFLYGRGAIDMKDQTAAEAVAAVAPRPQRRQVQRHAEGHQRRRRGDRRVARRQVDHRGAPGAARASTTCSTRAAARSCPTATARLYGVCVAEKGTFRFNVKHHRHRRARLRARRWRRNALLELAPLIVKLGEGRPSFDLTEADARRCSRRSARTRATRRGARERPRHRAASSPRCSTPR